MKKILIKVFKYLFDALSWCLTIVATVGIVFGFIFPLFGYKPYVVLSGSMEPQIQTGSIVMIDENDTDVEINDIIAYQLDNEMAVTHRVIDKQDGNFITKGDANEVEDLNPVSEQQVIGTYMFSVPKVGYVVTEIQTKPVILIPIISGICLILLGNSFFDELNKTDKRNKKRGEN